MSQRRMKEMDQCVRHLATAVSTTSLYGHGHQQVLRLCENARVRLENSLGEEAGLSLKRVDDQLAVENQSLEPSIYSDRFARMLKSCGVGHVKFLKGLTIGELQQMVDSLARRDTTVRSSEHLRFGQIELKYRQGSAGSDRFGPEVARLLAGTCSEELARIMDVYEDVSKDRKLRVVGLSEIVNEFIDIFSNCADPLLTLVPLRTMDEYTFTHSLNVCLLNLGQATALGIEGPMLHDIGLSALLHDIGKLFVPIEVLNKAGRLENEEWDMLKEHPLRGAEYLVKSPGVPRMAILSAYEHHMRFDQRGYPSVRKDWQQSLCSHITALSDTYDALRTNRPYRSPMPVDEVLDNIVQLKGTQFHPVLVENFVMLMRKVHPAH
jgi:HD-GYP domain-containing protein (c-di-GMP phosphodiesterase class II)